MLAGTHTNRFARVDDEYLAVTLVTGIQNVRHDFDHVRNVPDIHHDVHADLVDKLDLRRRVIRLGSLGAAVSLNFRYGHPIDQSLFIQGIRQVLQRVGAKDDRDHLHAVRLQDGGKEQVDEPHQAPAARDIEEYLGFQLRIGVSDGIEVNNPPAHRYVQDKPAHRDGEMLEQVKVFAFLVGDKGPDTNRAIENESTEVRGQGDTRQTVYRLAADGRDNAGNRDQEPDSGVRRTLFGMNETQKVRKFPVFGHTGGNTNGGVIAGQGGTDDGDNNRDGHDDHQGETQMTEKAVTHENNHVPNRSAGSDHRVHSHDSFRRGGSGGNGGHSGNGRRSSGSGNSRYSGHSGHSRNWNSSRQLFAHHEIGSPILEHIGQHALNDQGHNNGFRNVLFRFNGCLLYTSPS